MSFKVAEFFAELGLKVDTREVKKLDDALNKLRASLKGLNQHFQREKAEGNLEKKRFSIEKMINRLQEAGGEVEEFKTALAGISKRKDFDKLALEIDKAREAQRRLNRETGQSGGRASGGDSETKKLRDRLTRQQGFQDLFVAGRGAARGDAQRGLVHELNRIRKSIDGTEASYRKANNALRRLNRETKAASAATRAYERRVGSLKWTTETLTSSFGNMARSYVGAFAVMSAAQKSFNVALEQEGFRARLALTSTDKADSEDTVRYIEQTSDRLGLKMLEFGSSFMKFQASVSPDEMSKDQIKDVFTGVSEAITAFGLTGQEAGFVQRALVQMASKGKISMEELRLQMSENMPGAMRFFAEGIGVSVEKLNEMAKKGELISSKTLPKFAQRLREVAAPALEERTQGLTANLNKMSNAWVKVNEAVFDAGASDAVKDVAQFLKETANGSNGLAKALGVIIKVVVKFGTILGNTLMLPLKAFNGIIEKIELNMGAIKTTIGVSTIPAFLLLLRTVNTIMGPFKKLFWTLTIIFLLVEDIMAIWDPNKEGLIETWLGGDTGETIKELRKLGADIFDAVLGGQTFSEWVAEGLKGAFTSLMEFLSNTFRTLGKSLAEGFLDTFMGEDDGRPALEVDPDDSWFTTLFKTDLNKRLEGESLPSLLAPTIPVPDWLLFMNRAESLSRRGEAGEPKQFNFHGPTTIQASNIEEFARKVESQYNVDFVTE